MRDEFTHIVPEIPRRCRTCAIYIASIVTASHMPLQVALVRGRRLSSHPTVWQQSGCPAVSALWQSKEAPAMHVHPFERSRENPIKQSVTMGQPIRVVRSQRYIPSDWYRTPTPATKGPLGSEHKSNIIGASSICRAYFSGLIRSRRDGHRCDDRPIPEPRWK